MNQPILIVDDDQTSNFVTSMIIRRVRPNAKIVTALNGQEAVNYFENEASEMPEYLLLDINMPVMNGFEFLNWLYDNPRIGKPKIIMYTSSVREEDRKEAERFNAVVAYVEKPLNNEVFEKILNQN